MITYEIQIKIPSGWEFCQPTTVKKWKKDLKKAKETFPEDEFKAIKVLTQREEEFLGKC